MDLGRAARGGQKPTTPTTGLIKGYSTINAYYATRLDLRSMRERDSEDHYHSRNRASSIACTGLT